MKSRRCPNCGHEQSYKLESCEKCLIFFIKWDAKLIREAREAQRPNVPSELDEWKARLPFFAAAAVLLIALLRLLAPSSSGPLLPGSFLSEAHQFALLVPDGWEAEPKTILLGEFASVLTLRSPGELPEIPAVFGVALTQKPIPEVWYNHSDAFLPFVSAALPEVFQVLTIGNVRRDRLDGLKATCAEGTGSKEVVRTESVLVPFGPQPKGVWIGGRYHPPKPDPSKMRFEQQTLSRPEGIRFSVCAARSADKTVLVGAASRLAESASREPEFQKVLSSFRVLYRPYSLKHLLRRALFELRKETLAFLLSAAWLLYKWILTGLFD
ncbi:MAG TPA: hypothetical protein DCM05_06115 [Elusimicrobia bacterium]|nr:hypothetical protein [Elusimicrobiota bacterium]